MHIRCERCSTVYELDEGILPAGGAPVQCSRCQHLFQAYPPAAPGETLRTPTPAAAPSAAPPAAGPDGASDAIDIQVRRIRSRERGKRLAPLLLLVAAGALGGALWHGSRQVSLEAAEGRRDGLRLLAGDDSRSLERAAEILTEAARRDPKLFQARADRALALTLLAADERERAAALEAGLRALDAERLRLEAEEGEAWQRRRADVIERMRALEERGVASRDRATRLAGEASADLGVLGGSHEEDPAVARALAVHLALDGDAEQASRVVRNARAARLADPWLDLAEAAGDVVAANTELARQRAVTRLAPLAAAHPELLRVGMLLARAQADLGRTDAALAALDGVLEANAAHDRAREMKERLLEPPAAEPLRPRVPQEAPPPGRPGLLPRKAEGSAR